MSLLRAINPVMASQFEAQQLEQKQLADSGSLMRQIVNDLAPKPAQEQAPTGNAVVDALTVSPTAQGANQQLAKQKELSPLERQRAMAIKMITSGNRFLQTKGYDMLAKYQDTATSDPDISNSGKIAIDAGYKPGTPEYFDFVKKHSMKSQSINIGGKKSGYLTREEKIAGGLDPDAPFVWGANGEPQPVKTSGFTLDQQKAHGFHMRMTGAAEIFDELEEAGFDPTTYQQKISSMIPVFGGEFMTPKQKLYQTAAMDWARSKLRFESGAVIGDKEAMDEAKLYFPQPGDGWDVIQLKKRFRNTAQKAMLHSSGRVEGKDKGATSGESDGSVERKPGDTWSDDKYDYRINDQGETQRRAK